MTNSRHSKDVLQKLDIKRYWFTTPQSNKAEYLDLTSFQPISAPDLSTFKEINQKIPISLVGTDDDALRQNDKLFTKGYSYLDNVTFPSSSHYSRALTEDLLKTIASLLLSFLTITHAIWCMIWI